MPPWVTQKHLGEPWVSPYGFPQGSEAQCGVWVRGISQGQLFQGL